MTKSCLPVFSIILLAIVPSLVFAEFENTEVLRVSVKINDDLKDMPVRVDGPEPIFITLDKKDTGSFVDMSVYLAGETGKQFTVTSDLNDFNVIVDGGKIVGKQKDKVTFLSQDSRIQIYVYGAIPQKTVMNILKVAGTSDLVNVLGKTTVTATTEDNAVVSNSASYPLLDKLDKIISDSNLPEGEKSSLLLKKENLVKMYQKGDDGDAEKLVLQIINSYENKTSEFAEVQRDCEKAKLKILEVEDRLAAVRLPENILRQAQQNLEYAKKSYESSLCSDSFTYAEKALQDTSVDPFTLFNESYPFVIPGSLISAVAIGGVLVFRKVRGGESFSGGS